MTQTSHVDTAHFSAAAIKAGDKHYTEWRRAVDHTAALAENAAYKLLRAAGYIVSSS